MNRIISMMLVVIAASSALVFAGTPIKQSELPKAAQTFLSVDLASGAEVDFRANGDWKKVKAAHSKAVPAAIVPATISKYVSTNHAGLSIVEISRKRGGYEVELSNGTELKLTEDAKPFTEKYGGQRGNRPRR